MDLDRTIAGRLRLEPLLHALLVVTALVLRLVSLATRPLHHDESIHAYYSWRILTAGLSDYRYDPVYHGPSLYYLTAVLHAVFGPSDFSARLLPVFCGVGIVALAWPLRRFVGRSEALVFGALVTFSPTFGYYSRSLRHDVPMAFFTLAAVVFFLSYVERRRKLDLYAAGALIGVAAATKEDIYLTGFVFANALWIVGLWGAAPGGAPARLRGWLVLVWSFVVASWRPLLTAILIALTVAGVLYTSMLTHPENWNAVSRALRYWWGQHEMRRIGGPWWYYLPLEIAYEPLIFLPAVFVAARWLFREAPSRTDALFAAWAVLAFAVYAWAQEKVPWLLIPFLVPQTILAARFFASPQFVRAGGLARLLTGGVGLFTVWSLLASNFLHDAPRTTEPPSAAHAEPLVYVQSTYDIPGVLAEIESVARTLGTGKQTPMVVTGEATWPLSWYLREYPVNWGSLPRETSAPIIIVDPDEATRLERDLGERYGHRRFAVRGWWQIDWSLVSAANVARFLLYRLAWNPPGTTDAVLLVAKDLAPGRALAAVPLTPPPPTRAYPADPVPIAAARVLGRPGTGPGEFREPRGLAVDRDGNLLVADSKNNRIQKLDREGRSLGVWGGPAAGDAAGRYRDPCGVAAAPDGSVYVADTWNHRIQKLDGEGRFILEWREQDPSFWGPRAVAVAPDGAIFVADTGNKRILAYDPGGARLRSFGGEGGGNGQFVEPVGIAIDPATKTVYVADTGNHRVQSFDLEGRYLAQWTAFGWQEFYTEPYLAWQGGTLWATDSFNQRVNRYDPAGDLLESIGGRAAPLALDRPIGIAAAPDGELYVADTMNHRVLALSPHAIAPAARSPAATPAR